MLNFKLLVFVFLFLLAGCTVTGPADDGFENQHEWVDNGRLFDDETKTIYSSEKQSEQSAKSAAAEASPTTAMDITAWQQWSDARENNTAEYKKFQQWQEFEAYDRWKRQQQSE